MPVIGLESDSAFSGDTQVEVQVLTRGDGEIQANCRHFAALVLWWEEGFMRHAFF